MRKIFKIYTIGIISTVLLTAGCHKSESYAELLTKEEHAVNWYLSGESVEVNVPADSIFQEGEDAPFYRMDEEGNVYMQVINSGDLDDRPQPGDRVYFRYSRMNLRNLYEAGIEMWIGNASNLNPATGNTSFIFGNQTLPSTTQYGTGIQLPLNYVGYNSRVRLVLKSQAGFAGEQSQCLPYVVDVRYFKGEY